MRTAKKVGLVIVLGICGFLTIAAFAADYLAGIFFALLTVVVLKII